MVRHAKSSVAESGTLDYAVRPHKASLPPRPIPPILTLSSPHHMTYMQDVAHSTVTTPVVAGKTNGAEKRKQQAMAKEATRQATGASSKGGKENSVQFRNLPEDTNKEKEAAASHKRAKTDGTTTPSSVRYPRLAYGELIPPTDKLLASADVTDEEKVLYLARRVMEADTLEVENILLSTKYSHLSAEMSTYAEIVEKRLSNALAADTALEKQEVKELVRLQARKAKEEKECAALDKEAAALRMDLAKWQALEKQVEAEGQQLPALVEKARKKEAARQDDTPYGTSESYPPTHSIHPPIHILDSSTHPPTSPPHPNTNRIARHEGNQGSPRERPGGAYGCARDCHEPDRRLGEQAAWAGRLGDDSAGEAGMFGWVGGWVRRRMDVMGLSHSPTHPLTERAGGGFPRRSIRWVSLCPRAPKGSAGSGWRRRRRRREEGVRRGKGMLIHFIFMCVCMKGRDEL